MENADIKTCPFCGEEILAIAKKCKHCGEWLDYNDTQEKNQIIHCQYCGKAVSSSAEKCPNCGEWLKDENVELSCGYALNNKATKIILDFSIIVAIITFIVCFILNCAEPNKTVEQTINGFLAAVFIPVIVFIACFISAYIYFLPTIFAVSRKHPQIQPIFLVNLFFGETVIGWVGCMVWATTHRHGRHTHW